MPLEEKCEHESYGMVGISNVSCGAGQVLFGSSIKHSRTIRLRIKRAAVERSLHKEWFYGHESIVEVELSAAQFAEFITTPNTGDGVPCTIRYVEGRRMEDPPYSGQNEKFHAELQEDFAQAMDGANDLLSTAEEMLSGKGAMKASDKKVLLGKIKGLTRHIKENMPFVHKQFTRAMEKTVTQAKAEVEQFYTSTIMKMGKKSLEAGHKPDKPLIEE